MLSWIFIAIAHRSINQQVGVSLHSDTLFYPVNQAQLNPLYDICLVYLCKSCTQNICYLVILCFLLGISVFPTWFLSLDYILLSSAKILVPFTDYSLIHTIIAFFFTSSVQHPCPISRYSQEILSIVWECHLCHGQCVTL